MPNDPYTRRFGLLKDLQVGQHFDSRDEIRLAGLHAHNQNGISGTKRDGADAIALSGGYPDDKDFGD
jgi:putative restriction endonuclease